ncbi:MAG TPA: oxidoreductase [Frankiaceae bacterium]|jgi:NAD(P)-dependent dehydrogenase (short-subunit alcohol dehydrogenase family)|nr:oxidoreductase [Frankiaceae bacterium]
MGPVDAKTAVVTGANSGLGYQTSRQLAGQGARVIMACRDAERGQQALERLRSEVPDAKVELRSLDLADLSSVKTFADGLEGPVHLLINNAGVMALPARVTADDFEMQFGTNHLGHFALTGRLLPALKAAPGARVVTVSSEMHRIGRINFDDLQSLKRYQKWPAYGQSKLANLLFTAELSRRAARAGLDLRSLSAHPGYATTNLQTTGPKMGGNKIAERFVGLGNTLFGQSDTNGALPILYAATEPSAQSGEYIGPDGLFHMRGSGAKPGKPMKKALDQATAARLWDVSEQLTGVTYAFSA